MRDQFGDRGTTGGTTAGTPAVVPVREFHRDGFLQRSQVFDSEIIAALRRQVEVLGSETPADPGLLFQNGRLFQIFDVPARGGALWKLTQDPRIVGVAECLLGEAVAVASGLLLEKTPETNWDIRWHQDTSAYCREIPNGEQGELRGGLATFRPRDATMGRLVVARVPLDLDTAYTGGLIVSPGTHRLGRLPPEEAATSADGPGVALEQRPGDVLFFNPLLLHRAERNRGSRHRRVLHITYRPVSLRLPAGARWIDW